MPKTTDAAKSEAVQSLTPAARALLLEHLATLDAPRFSEADLAAAAAFNAAHALFSAQAYRPGMSLEALSALTRAAFGFAEAATTR